MHTVSGIDGSREMDVQEPREAMWGTSKNGDYNGSAVCNIRLHFPKNCDGVEEAKMIEDLEMCRWYYNTLDPIFCLRLDRRLEAKNLDHDPAEPYPMDKMFNAASYILKGTPTMLDKGDLQGATMTQDRRGWSSTPEPLVKREPADFE
jgi:hypothetical protein